MFLSIQIVAISFFKYLRFSEFLRVICKQMYDHEKCFSQKSLEAFWAIEVYIFLLHYYEFSRRDCIPQHSSLINPENISAIRKLFGSVDFFPKVGTRKHKSHEMLFGRKVGGRLHSQGWAMLYTLGPVLPLKRKCS